MDHGRFGEDPGKTKQPSSDVDPKGLKQGKSSTFVHHESGTSSSIPNRDRLNPKWPFQPEDIHHESQWIKTNNRIE